MEIIRNGEQPVIDFLGGYQKIKENRDYRLCKYVFECDYDNLKLLYNSVTGAICALREVEYKTMWIRNCFHNSWLIENYFFVPIDFDEDQVVEEYRSRNLKHVTANYLDKISVFTIFTTLKCNARCFYCYELAKKGKKHMTIETAEKLVKYICDSTYEGQTVKLDWFGGEPLMNTEIIDYITSRVESSGRVVTAGMISNGYLFDEQTINTAKNYWHLTNVQITLDGTEEQYNKTKSYIYKNVTSPFKTVISNIHNLVAHGICVTIRLNVDNKNMNNMNELIDYLCKEFENERGNCFSIYCFQIFEINGYERTPEEVDELSNKLIEFNHKLSANGFGYFTQDICGIKTGHCMIDSNDCVTIDPDGNIGVCEHHYDKHLWSHIDNLDVRNYDEIKYWQTKMPQDSENCLTCKLRPACLKVPDCPSHRECRGDERKLQYDKISLGLIQLYIDHLRSKNNECNGQNCCSANSTCCNCNCEGNG